MGESNSKGLKILSLSATYPFIHLKEKTNNGSAILYYTTINGRLEVFKLFLGQFKKLKPEEKLECITSVGAQGRTFLHSAADQESLAVIKLILDEEGFPLLTGLKLFEFVNIKDELGCTALHLAVQNNQYDIAEYLLDFGGNNLSSRQQLEHIALVNKDGRTGLHLAAVNGYIDIVKLLVKKVHLVVSSGLGFLRLKDKYGFSAAFLAYLKKHYEIYDYLLNEGQYDSYEKETHLKYSLETFWYNCEEKDVEYVTLCLEFGEELLSLEKRREILMAMDEQQRTVFHLSAYNNRAKTLKYLLNDTTLSKKELKNVLMLQDGDECTAFHSAVCEAERGVAKPLIDKIRAILSFEELKTFFGLRNAFGDTVLHSALKRCNFDMLKLLLEELVGLEEVLLMKDDCSNTVFHLAAEKERHDLMALLLDFFKESLNSEQLSFLLLAKNKYEVTAFQMLVIGGHLKMVELLFEGDTVSDEDRITLIKDTDKLHRTVFHISVTYRHTALLEYLLEESDILLPPKYFKSLMMSPDSSGSTIFDIAQESGQLDVLNILSLKMNELNANILSLETCYREKSVRTSKNEASVDEKMEYPRLSKKENWEYVFEFISNIANALSVEQRRIALMATDDHQRTVFHVLAYNNRLAAIRYLLKDPVLSDDDFKTVLMLRDDEKCTAFHLAVSNADWLVAKLVLDKIRTLLSFDELKTFFRLRNRIGDTVLFTAVKKCDFVMLKFLLEEISEMNDFFCMKDDLDNSVFHLAEFGCSDRYDIMKLLLDFAKKFLKSEELSSLLLAKNKYEETAFDGFVACGHLEVMELMLKEDILSVEEQKILLTKTDALKRTVFHNSVASNHDAHFLSSLLSMSGDRLTTKEFSSVLLSRDTFGFTVFDIAKENNRYDLLKCLKEELEKKVMEEDESRLKPNSSRTKKFFQKVASKFSRKKKI